MDYYLATYYNMDESQKHYVEWKKPDMKEHHCMIPFV